MEREVLNAQEAADFLRLSEATFRNISPAIPGHKIPGSSIRYLRSELLTWLASHGRSGEPLAEPLSNQLLGNALSNEGVNYSESSGEYRKRGKVKRLV